jgi:hypothetical protein
MFRQIYVLLTLTIIALGAAHAQAEIGCCAMCGCCDHHCEKVCRLVCEEKKVEVVCWGAKCEDFCVPGPSECVCKNCEMVCEDCTGPEGCCSAFHCYDNEVHTHAKPFVWREWMPGCAKVFTRRKLMKKSVFVSVPSYKWVVEDVCDQCGPKCQSVAVPADTEIPPPPVVNARIVGPQWTDAGAAATTSPR